MDININDAMDINMSSLGTLVCFMQQGVKFTEVWHIMWFLTSTLIWYHTHKDTKHTQELIDWHTHKNTYLHHLLSDMKNLLYRVPQCLCFSKIAHLSKSHLLIRFNITKFFPWNTKNTDRNGINKQNTHTYTKQSEKDNIGKC